MRRSGFIIFAAAWSLAGVIAGAGDAHAAVGLKQVQVANGSNNGTQVDLLFDGKISKGQIKTEFLNDVIQLSLSDVSVYPAKILSVNGQNLVKVFAYQYAPNIVRCRLTVNGKSDQYKNKFRISAGGASGKIVTISLQPRSNHASDKVVMSASQAMRSTPSGAGGSNAQEKELLEHVLKGSQKASPPKEQSAAPVTTLAKPENKLDKQPKSKNEERLGRAEKKSEKRGLKMILRLAAVLVAFVAIAFVVRRYFRRSSDKLRGRLSKLIKKRTKMIEVLATHYLGPKKSIAIVKVAGRVLVLGVTNDNINLIQSLNGEGLNNEPNNIDDERDGADPSFGNSFGTGAVAAGPPQISQNFMDMIGHAAIGQSYDSTGTGGGTDIRAKIRSKLEGMKPL
ncbi:MAG: flagellar biosynthetic protein FliO [Bdellovibrionota bacterium]|mgnify:CR=1 FL=1